jgi:hypothetical protein
MEIQTLAEKIAEQAVRALKPKAAAELGGEG